MDSTISGAFRRKITVLLAKLTFVSISQGGIADEHTFLGYYSSWLVQFLGGLNYMILFGVVLSMEIGFCKFIETCSNDLKQTSLSLNKSDFTNARLSKTILKEAFELHQKVLQ